MASWISDTPGAIFVYVFRLMGLMFLSSPSAIMSSSQFSAALDDRSNSTSPARNSVAAARADSYCPVLAEVEPIRPWGTAKAPDFGECPGDVVLDFAKWNDVLYFGE